GWSSIVRCILAASGNPRRSRTVPQYFRSRICDRVKNLTTGKDPDLREIRVFLFPLQQIDRYRSQIGIRETLEDLRIGVKTGFRCDPLENIDLHDVLIGKTVRGIVRGGCCVAEVGRSDRRWQRVQRPQQQTEMLHLWFLYSKMSNKVLYHRIVTYAITSKSKSTR